MKQLSPGAQNKLKQVLRNDDLFAPGDHCAYRPKGYPKNVDAVIDSVSIKIDQKNTWVQYKVSWTNHGEKYTETVNSVADRIMRLNKFRFDEYPVIPSDFLDDEEIILPDYD
jgi:hypothetical protein